MSMISEQVNELREYSCNNCDYGARLAKKAADTIEALFAKLQAANMERSDRYYSGGWIACEDRLPENSKNKGSFCPKYYVMTKYGKTIGWYNPDYNSWFVLIWFMTERYLTEEIDMERGDIPKIVRAPLECGIVNAWKSFDEPYRP